jgi:hypothetical protein
MSVSLSQAIHSPWRWVAALALVANAYIHIELTPHHLMEAQYIGVLFIVLSVACIVLTAGLLFFDNVVVWGATGLVSVAGLAAFVASRMIGLPLITDEIGYWSDPWGTATMVVEVVAIAVAGVVLLGAPAHRRKVSAGEPCCP